MKQEHEAMVPISRRYLDVQSAAIYLGTTPTAIYAAVARRQIPHRRFGRKLVFDKVELDMFVKALEGVSKDEAIARTMHGGTMK
jgi:excisionase family DNA binding protein